MAYHVVFPHKLTSSCSWSRGAQGYAVHLAVHNDMIPPGTCNISLTTMKAVIAATAMLALFASTSASFPIWQFMIDGNEIEFGQFSRNVVLIINVAAVVN